MRDKTGDSYWILLASIVLLLILLSLSGCSSQCSCGCVDCEGFDWAELD